MYISKYIGYRIQDTKYMVGIHKLKLICIVRIKLIKFEHIYSYFYREILGANRSYSHLEVIIRWDK